MPKSRSRSKRSKKINALNKYFDKIFVINLFDKVQRWEKVEKQFKNRKINVERFVAIDGRCSKEGDKGCKAKLKSFEIAYDVKISNKAGYPLKELVPASSLTIGTILLLREMVRKGWKRMLICEDDVELTNGLESKFERGIKEIGNYKWDLLYLGCGGSCGNNGVDYEYSEKNKYLSDVARILEDEFYVSKQEDLRYPCDDKCKPFSEHITHAYKPGGTWAYAYSLAGAKKVLKLLDDDAGNHIDKLIVQYTGTGQLKALAFDEPIIYHEGGAIRTDTDIPWEWI